MWRNPLLIAGQGESAQVFITERTEQADLFVLLGQPSTPIDWEITVDGVDMLGFRIESTFPAGSTFSFTLINGARIIGFGGFGGNGASVSSTSVGSGARGGAGGDAISSVFPISMDADDGYLLGGGGGGGGGAAYQVPSTPQTLLAGSGGGGGAGFALTIDSPTFPGGFFTSSGGIAGSGYNTQATPQNGGFGDGDIPGAGGLGATMYGGNGGVFGSAGLAGVSLTPFFQGLGSGFKGTGGAGGNAGRAYYGTGSNIMTLTGSKSEATLRAEGRIKGQSKSPYFVGLPINRIGDLGTDNRYHNDASIGGASTHGFVFNSNGTMQLLNGDNNPLLSNLWLSTSGAVGADFEMRQVSGPGTTLTGNWDFESSAINVWTDLSTARTYSFTHDSGSSSIRNTGRLFEFRRADVPGNPDDEVLGRMWLLATDEDAV